MSAIRSRGNWKVELLKRKLDQNRLEREDDAWRVVFAPFLRPHSDKTDRRSAVIRVAENML